MNPTCIRLGGPSDILAVLPYQLGFHPRDSLVVVSLHGTRMGLVQRIDLPAAEQAPRAVRPSCRRCSGRRRTACCCWATRAPRARRCP